MTPLASWCLHWLPFAVPSLNEQWVASVLYMSEVMLIWGVTAAAVMNCVIGAITCSIEVLPIKIVPTTPFGCIKRTSKCYRILWSLCDFLPGRQFWEPEHFVHVYIHTYVCCIVTGECAFLLIYVGWYHGNRMLNMTSMVVAYDPFHVHIACHISNTRELLLFGHTVKVCGEKAGLWVVAYLHRHSSAKCPIHSIYVSICICEIWESEHPWKCKLQSHWNLNLQKFSPRDLLVSSAIQ